MGRPKRLDCPRDQGAHSQVGPTCLPSRPMPNQLQSIPETGFPLPDLLGRGARRVHLARLVAAAGSARFSRGVTLVVAAGIAVQLSGWRVPGTALGALGLACASLVVLAVRVRPRPADRFQAARLLDQYLGLEGRVLAAADLYHRAPDDPWRQLAVDDLPVHRLCCAAVGDATPLRLPRSLWLFVALVPVALISGALDKPAHQRQFQTIAVAPAHPSASAL
jgi:hypothetical protein